jgi:hypothetical protein
MRISKVALAILFLFSMGLPGRAQKKISPFEAKDHINATATVCGKVVSTRFAASTKGQPTFLNLEKALPKPSVYGRYLGE